MARRTCSAGVPGLSAKSWASKLECRRWLEPVGFATKGSKPSRPGADTAAPFSKGVDVDPAMVAARRCCPPGRVSPRVTRLCRVSCYVCTPQVRVSNCCLLTVRRRGLFPFFPKTLILRSVRRTAGPAAAQDKARPCQAIVRAKGKKKATRKQLKAVRGRTKRSRALEKKDEQRPVEPPTHN